MTALDRDSAPSAAEPVGRDKGVLKAVELLRALRTAGAGGGGARELARDTGLPRSTVQRLLTTLAETELITQDPRDQRYRIGPLALWIGLGFGRAADLIALARPLLERLRDATGETAGLSVAVGDARMFVAEIQSRSGLRYASELGRPYPLWSGSMGRVLLSDRSPERIEQVLAARDLAGEVDRPISVEQTRHLIAQVRQEGYATAFAETLIGTSSVAVAVTDAVGEIVAAISLGGPETRLTRDRMLEALPLLREVSADLTARLGSQVTVDAPGG